MDYESAWMGLGLINFESSCFISFLDFGHFRLVELNTGSSNFRLFFEFKIYIYIVFGLTLIRFRLLGFGMVGGRVGFEFDRAMFRLVVFRVKLKSSEDNFF